MSSRHDIYIDSFALIMKYQSLSMQVSANISFCSYINQEISMFINLVTMKYIFILVHGVIRNINPYQ